MEENIKKAAEIVNESNAILITAGAGIGVDSGLPDFRGNEGFWKAYPPMAKLGISFSGMANPRWFISNPRLAWGFYGHRLNLYRKTIPHEGFNILMQWAKSKGEDYFIFTSNVDGQFQKAGFDEDRITECHGSIHWMQSIDPRDNLIWSGENVEVIVNEETFEAEEPLPMCPDNQSPARPNILMFSDWQWIPDRSNAQENRLSNWLTEKRKQDRKICIIELGAGTAVATVRFFSERTASMYGANLIRINPRDTHVPAGQISICSGAKEGINLINELL